MSTVYDVCIIGAGPGGSNAAAVALRHQLTVVQIDKASFPRVKPCGGGMTMKAVHALQVAGLPAPLATFSRVAFSLWGSSTHRFSSPGQLISMVSRPSFDNALVAHNQQSPHFTFLDAERVLAVTFTGGVFHIRTDKQQDVQARQLVGADGAYSLVNKTFGIAHPRAFATAIEVTVPRAALVQPTDLIPSCDFGAVAQGYGWVFPKGEVINVGVYTFHKGAKGLREQLMTYLQHKHLAVAEGTPLTFEAQQIPVGGSVLRPNEAPVYIVGDAGGFADAVTGEGIYHALESGRLAGEALSQVAQGSRSHYAYYHHLWRTVLPDTLLTFQLSRVVYSHLPTAVRLFTLPWIWRPLVQGYAEGATVTESLLKSGSYLVKSYCNQTGQERDPAPRVEHAMARRLPFPE